jgi:hypothetical protein
LQDKVVQLLPEVWEAPADINKQSNIADLLHLAVSLPYPSATAMLQLVQEMRQQQAVLTSGRSSIQKKRQKVEHAQQTEQLQQRLQEFDRQVNAAELEQLLATAVARMQPAVVEQLSLLPAVKQLPAAAVSDLIRKYIVHRSPSPAVLARLLQLAMSVDAATALVTVFGPSVFGSTQQQCTHKQMLRQHLQVAGPEQLHSYMQAAIQSHNTAAVMQFVKLPAASMLNGAALASLIELSVVYCNPTILAELCQLPGMQQVQPEGLGALLLSAVHMRCAVSVQQLAELPGAAQMEVKDVMTLLDAAVHCQAGEQIIRILLALPASRDIHSMHAASLIQAALRSEPAYQTVSALLEMLPSAASMDANILEAMLMSAVTNSYEKDQERAQLLQQLCGLSPAAQSIGAAAAKQIFKAAATANHVPALAVLCQLPAAAQMTADDLHVLMMQRLQHSNSYNVQAVTVLCVQLAPAAMQLQAQQVHALMLALLKKADFGLGDNAQLQDAVDALGALSQLPAAEGLSAHDVASLIDAMLQMQMDAVFLKALLELPAAISMDTQQVSGLLQTAIRNQRYQMAQRLLQLPASAAMADVQALQCTQVLLQHIDDLHSFYYSEPLYMALLQLPAVKHATNAAEFANVVWAVLRLSQHLQRERIDMMDQMYIFSRQAAWLQPLLALPAARLVEAAMAVDMLRYAMQEQHESVRELCQLPAAQQFDAAAVSALLRSAFVGQHSIYSQHQLQYLCALPGAQQLQPWQLHPLLQHAVVYRGSHAVECLASLQRPAAGMSKAALLGLLDAAIRSNNYEVSKISTLYNVAVNNHTTTRGGGAVHQLRTPPWTWT